MSILLTGAAGFIGFHVAKALLDRGERVVGIDNLNDYYDVRLKEARLDLLRADPGFAFAKLDVADRDGILALVEGHRDLRSIIHLAAQAGVRYSLENPYAYVDANVMGTLVMFEAARRIERLTGITYASSSSVYGANRQQPFSVEDRVAAFQGTAESLPGDAADRLVDVVMNLENHVVSDIAEIVLPRSA